MMSAMLDFTHLRKVVVGDVKQKQKKKCDRPYFCEIIQRGEREKYTQPHMDRLIIYLEAI